jgi:hypothetical protein
MKKSTSFLRFARKELLRGPLGYPLALRSRMRPVGRLTITRPENLRLWRLLARLGLSLEARKALFRAIYPLPFAPADAGAPWRVARRHREFFEGLRTAV